MGRRSTLRRGLKHRRANSSSNQNQRLHREKVNISDDTWLEALKFMTYPQWSKKCFVSRQINGLAEHNISRLPKMVIDSATMSYNCADSREDWKILPHNKYTIVAFDTIMQEEQSKDWFMNRGLNLDAPVDILAENIINGAKKWSSGRDSNINLCIHGAAQEKIPLSEEDKRYRWFINPPSQQFRKPVLYYAQFNPLLNQDSWNYLAQFLKFVYDPMTYVKEIEMFAVNQNFIDTLQCNIDSIECESLLIKTEDEDNQTVVLSNSLKWLSRNVRAENIYIDNFCEEEFDLFANFLLDPSGAKQCASKKVEFDMDHSSISPFFQVLFKKSNEIRRVGSTNLTLLFTDQEDGSPDAGLLYVISSGHHLMWLSLRTNANSLYEKHTQFQFTHI